MESRRFSSAVTLGVLALAVFALSGCLGDASGPAKSHPYPLAVGNSWLYNHTIEYQNGVFDTSSGFGYFYLPYQGTTDVRIIEKDTLSDTLEVFVFRAEEESENPLPMQHDAYAYANNTDDGFYLYAYEWGSTILPAKPQTRRFTFRINGRDFTSLSDLGENLSSSVGSISAAFSPALEIVDPPARSLAYPLRIGSRWTYRRAGDPFRIDKKVVEYEPISVPTGTEKAYVIQYKWDMDKDGHWDKNLNGFEYISRRGLIKREFFYYDVEVINEELEVIGTVDVIETYVLVETNL